MNIKYKNIISGIIGTILSLAGLGALVTLFIIELPKEFNGRLEIWIIPALALFIGLKILYFPEEFLKKIFNFANNLTHKFTDKFIRK